VRSLRSRRWALGCNAVGVVSTSTTFAKARNLPQKILHGVARKGPVEYASHIINRPLTRLGSPMVSKDAARSIVLQSLILESHKRRVRQAYSRGRTAPLQGQVRPREHA